MAFIEIDKHVRNDEWVMHSFHSHSHYEIYYLVKGSRSFFLANSLQKIKIYLKLLLLKMQEFLHLKEKALLKYIANHYKRTLEVQFTLFTINHTTVFINDFTTISVENLAELYNLLTSLMIRNYICFDEKYSYLSK